MEEGKRDFGPKKFSQIKRETPFLDLKDLKWCQYKENHFYLTRDELEKFEDVMTKKGNCSTNEAATKIAYGNVFDSHCLTFYLYNFCALQVINRFIENKQTCSVLELGCNNGHVSRLFQRNNFKFKEYWGMDFDFSFIVDGIDSFSESDNLFTSNFCLGNFNKPLNLKDNYFGLVYFQEAFDHCRDKFFYSEQCISEIKRVLKPGGFLYITLVFEHDYRDLYHWDHNYVWEKFQFENMIRDYFEIVNFSPLLTFEESMARSSDEKIQMAYKNWPRKFAKMICAHFVDDSETAVASYLLKNNK
jgi:SAM-dependent methyltransferase